LEKKPGRVSNEPLRGERCRAGDDPVHGVWSESGLVMNNNVVTHASDTLFQASALKSYSYN
jgi:hypothetical protein